MWTDWQFLLIFSEQTTRIVRFGLMLFLNIIPIKEQQSTTHIKILTTFGRWISRSQLNKQKISPPPSLFTPTPPNPVRRGAGDWTGRDMTIKAERRSFIYMWFKEIYAYYWPIKQQTAQDGLCNIIRFSWKQKYESFYFHNFLIGTSPFALA